MKRTQYQRLKELFTENPNIWIGLPKILDMRISQYGRVIGELRETMFIQNKTQTIEGERHSWFRYASDGQRILI